jgi:hypothetical protein
VVEQLNHTKSRRHGPLLIIQYSLVHSSIGGNVLLYLVVRQISRSVAEVTCQKEEEKIHFHLRMSSHSLLFIMCVSHRKGNKTLSSSFSREGINKRTLPCYRWWMSFILELRVSNCRCQSCSSPGFNPSILRHSGISEGRQTKQC